MSKKEEELVKNLEKIIKQAAELEWESLILTNPELDPQGIICGPKSFIDDFKSFTDDMKHLEEDLESFILQNHLEPIEEEDNVPDIKNDDDDDKTWH